MTNPLQTLLIVTIGVILSAVATASEVTNTMILSKDGESKAVIVVSDNASPPEKHAAAELANLRVEDRMASDVEKVRKILADGPLGKTKVRDTAGFNSSKWPRIFEHLVSTEVIITTMDGRTILCQLKETD